MYVLPPYAISAKPREAVCQNFPNLPLAHGSLNKTGFAQISGCVVSAWIAMPKLLFEYGLDASNIMGMFDSKLL